MYSSQMYDPLPNGQLNSWFGVSETGHQSFYEAGADKHQPQQYCSYVPSATVPTPFHEVYYGNQVHQPPTSANYICDSVTLSPSSIYPSSQSPSLSSDCSFTDFDITDLDEILTNPQPLDNQLIDMLDYAGCADLLYLDDFEFGNSPASSTTSSSSANSSPKRKYSTDSSDRYSVESFQSSPSSTGSRKRARRSKHTPEERIERKKNQNKTAASKYRSKKRGEQKSTEQVLEELETTQKNFSEQLKKLQTEFNVILPLAKAAFVHDSYRQQLLQNLLSRIGNYL